MPFYAVTVVGFDRPGIVAEVTEVVAGLGGNLEDSSMTLLRGHFAMTLVAAVEASGETLQEQLRGLTDSGLVVSVIELTDPDVVSPGGHFLLSVHGADRPGIVSSVTRLLAAAGGNIVDLSTRLSAGLYVLLASVELPEGADVAALAETLAARGKELGVKTRLRPVDEDVM